MVAGAAGGSSRGGGIVGKAKPGCWPSARRPLPPRHPAPMPRGLANVCGWLCSSLSNEDHPGEGQRRASSTHAQPPAQMAWGRASGNHYSAIQARAAGHGPSHHATATHWVAWPTNASQGSKHTWVRADSWQLHSWQLHLPACYVEHAWLSWPVPFGKRRGQERESRKWRMPSDRMSAMSCSRTV